MTVTANFFWHGPKLRLYERACLASFVKAGLTVHLHTFNDTLLVPEGVVRCDAGKFAHKDEVTSLTQGGKSGSIAAFTDLFRYRLFKSEPGWWFDTDVYCLAPAAAFEAIEKTSRGLLVGEEEPGKLNGAVLFVSDPTVAVELERRADAVGKSFPWGAIGPGLITDYVRETPGRCTTVPPETFYPIHYQEADMFFRVSDRAECERRGSKALSVHLWNEILTNWKVPVELMPCRGSYLAELFLKTDARVEPEAALPEATLEDLQYFGRIGPKGRALVRAVNGLRAAKQWLVDLRGRS
jgi:hypothetical protein